MSHTFFKVYHENMRASWGGVATLFYVLIPVLITISAILDWSDKLFLIIQFVNLKTLNKADRDHQKRSLFLNATFCKNTLEENAFATLSTGF